MNHNFNDLNNKFLSYKLFNNKNITNIYIFISLFKKNIFFYNIIKYTKLLINYYHFIQYKKILILNLYLF